MENLHKLRLLFLEEVDLGVLTELKGVDETGVFHKAATVVGLDLECGGEASPLALLLLPVAVHVSEDDAGVVTHLDLFSR